MTDLVSRPPDDAGSRPGRKRSEDSRLAILSAAIEIVDEIGYVGLSVEAIAKRAKTGKQTIYRWWPSKADVVMEALATKADFSVQLPEQSTFADDLRILLRASFSLVATPQIRTLLQILLAEAQQDPDFAARFRDHLLDRRRRALGRIVLRARDRGDLPSGLRPGGVVDAVYGAMWYRIACIPGPLDEAFVEELVHLVTR